MKTLKEDKVDIQEMTEGYWHIYIPYGHTESLCGRVIPADSPHCFLHEVPSTAKMCPTCVALNKALSS